MHRNRLHRRAAGFLAFTAALFASGAGARAATPQPSRFAGTYTVTQVGGAGVQRMELQLLADGHVSMRTTFSRLTQRPIESAVVPPVVERGTWHVHAGRAIVHITQTSSDDANAAADQKPQYTDLTFALSGCELRLVTDHGTTLEFSKRHCLQPS